MRRPHTVLIALACVVTLACLQVPIRRVALTILRSPLLAVEFLFSIALDLPRLPSLARENASLRLTLARQQFELVQLRDVVRHAGRAKDLRRASGDRPGVVARVIGRSTIPTQHLLVLDAGERDGVTGDSLMLDVEGLAGRVEEVSPRTSLGMLLTDPDSRVACLVERSRATGLAVGTGGHLCRFVDLELDADVVPGDRLLTAGLGTAFPKGLLVGTVVTVVRDERQASAWAWVRPAVRVNRLEEVFCLTAFPSEPVRSPR